MDKSNAVEVKNLEKIFAGRRVLSDLSLSLLEGSFTALLGKSGSGKTTLLHLLAGLDTPDRGEIRIYNRLLSQLDEEGRSTLRLSEIGLIFQFFNLLPGLSAFQNACLPGIFRGERRDAVEERVNVLFERFSLRKDALPDELSGGELQRVAIARALCNKPKLILADEPTGNLDSGNAEMVAGLLQELSAKDGITILMVTHDETLAGCAERQLRLEEGRIV
jgi:ABC-type lipoprotein export system ATPase subunit